MIEAFFSPLTEVIGDFVCSISEHPEEDSPCAPDRSSSFIHSRCHKHTSGVLVLHVHFTRDAQILPAKNKALQIIRGFFCLKKKKKIILCYR